MQQQGTGDPSWRGGRRGTNPVKPQRGRKPRASESSAAEALLDLTQELENQQMQSAESATNFAQAAMNQRGQKLADEVIHRDGRESALPLCMCGTKLADKLMTISRYSS